MIHARCERDYLMSLLDILRQFVDRDPFDQRDENALVELTRQFVFSPAPFGGEPVMRDKEEHRLALPCVLIDRALPALAGMNALRRIEIEKDVVPALALQPASNGDGGEIVTA